MPIRKGATTAKIVLDIGDNGASQLVVERRFTEKASLEVRNPEGFKAGSPQKILDDLVGAISMDPVAFLRQRAADQVETLRRWSASTSARSMWSASGSTTSARWSTATARTRPSSWLASSSRAEQPYEPVDVSALWRSSGRRRRRTAGVMATPEASSGAAAPGSTRSKEVADLREKLLPPIASWLRGESR